MNAWKRNKISISLVAASLLLLLLFQMFWLKNVYEVEKQAIVDEADQMFLDAVRSIEDSLFNELLFVPMKKIESQSSDSLKVDIDLIKEANFKVFIKTAENLDFDFNQIDSTNQIDIRSNMQLGKENKNFGSIAFTMASEGVTTFDTTINNSPFQPASLDLLKETLAKKITTSTLPQTHEVILFSENNDEKSGLLSNPHTDKFSDNIFAIHFPHYKNHIFKKIIPQVLFSFFLFSCIALSFFMVWKSLEKQRRLTELKNDFISNITHELKTPITTVGVALEALSNFNALQNPERTEEYLNISKHELSRLSILVDKVLKMSLFEKKEPELKIEMLDLQSMVQEVLSSMKLQFEKVAAQVNFQTKGNSFLLQGDKIHLTSVIYNLIDNALKYSPSKPVINLLLENTNDQVQLTIEDKGIGISNIDQDKIFEKFFRVPQGDQHNVKGYGLGLSYVASVIKKHQGDIKVNSQLNEGTSFIISLPK